MFGDPSTLIHSFAPFLLRLNGHFDSQRQVEAEWPDPFRDSSASAAGAQARGLHDCAVVRWCGGGAGRGESFFAVFEVKR